MVHKIHNSVSSTAIKLLHLINTLRVDDAYKEINGNISDFIVRNWLTFNLT